MARINSDMSRSLFPLRFPLSLDLSQVKLQSCQDQGTQLALFLGGATKFVAAFRQGENFQRAVGRVPDPVLLHSKLCVKFQFLVTVATDAGRRDEFDQ